MSFSYVCPKCGVSFTDDLEWDDIVRAHATDWREPPDSESFSLCIYVPCDDQDCRALRAPVTFEDFKRAHDHWRDHHLHHGCSHGC